MELKQNHQAKTLSKKRFNLRERKAAKNSKLDEYVLDEEDNFENAEESSASLNTESQVIVIFNCFIILLNQEGKTQNQVLTNGRSTRNRPPQDYKKMFNNDVFSDDDEFVPK